MRALQEQRPGGVENEAMVLAGKGREAGGRLWEAFGPGNHF